MGLPSTVGRLILEPMARLILLRHGDAAHGSLDQSDAERPLTHHGRRQAARVSELLDEAGWLPELVLTSPALRALTTAEAVAARSGVAVTTVPSLYDGGVRELQAQLCHVEPSIATVLVVGHNPTLSELASALTRVNVSLGTANAALVEARGDEGWSEAPRADATWRLHRHLLPV